MCRYLADVTKRKFNVKNSSFEMLVVFSPIFVADTKLIFVYNFVAPLGGTELMFLFTNGLSRSIKIFSEGLQSETKR